ncbi:MAG: hypothetical protein HRF43_01010 [Phycisphaerae bacterium]
MKTATLKLYGFSLPLMLPLLDFGFDQIIPFLKGPEFRALLAELVTQVLAGVADAFIAAAIAGLLG